MAKFKTSGFYLQSNSVINIMFTDGLRVQGLIMDINKRQISISNYINEEVAVAHHDVFKILHYAQDSIKEILLTANQVENEYVHISRANYEFSTLAVEEPCIATIDYKTVDYIDTTAYKTYQYLTYYKMENVYVKAGRMYYYDTQLANKRVGRAHKRRMATHDDCPLGLNMYDGTVRGLALGFSPDAKRSLAIDGVNLDLAGDNLCWFVYLPRLMFYKSIFKESDLKDLDHYCHNVRGRNKIKIKGLNISPGGDSGAIMIQGFSIAGIGQALYESNGLMVSGLFNRIYSFRGVNIAGLRNASSKGRGIQIGVSNYCKDFKGIQIGLWNRNGKRTLPFINWS